MVKLVRFVFIAAFLATLLPVSMQAQDAGEEALQDVRTALSRGDVEALIERSAARIDLTIFGTNEMLSRSQARYVVRSFFKEYPPTKVEFVDTSESDDNCFASAGYWYESASSPLSVYLRLRSAAGGWELRELRFDLSPPE